VIFGNARGELDNIDPISWTCTGFKCSFCLILAKLFNSTAGPSGRITDCIAHCGQVVVQQ